MALMSFVWYNHIYFKNKLLTESIPYSGEVCNFLYERYNKAFEVNKVIRNDTGLMADCVSKDDGIEFRVTGSNGSIHYDTYLQSVLESEFEVKLKELVEKYADLFRIRADLNFYHEPEIGEQRDVLYKLYKDLKRVPAIADVQQTETFSIMIDIYNDNYIDLKMLADEISKAYGTRNSIHIRRYNDKNEELERYEIDR
jgi:hypothetical protein